MENKKANCPVCKKELNVKQDIEYSEICEYCNESLVVFTRRNKVLVMTTTEVKAQIEQGEQAFINNKKHQNNSFRLILENKTNEKLLDVPLFNFKHKEQQKIEYIFEHCPNTFGETGYELFLRAIGSLYKAENIIIGARIDAVCGNEAIAEEQANVKMTVWHSNIFGQYAMIPVKFNVFDAQQQRSVAEVSMQMGGLSVNMNMSLEFLMPNTTAIITLFTKKREISDAE